MFTFVDVIGVVVAATLGVILLVPPLIAALAKFIRRMMNWD